MAYSLDTFSISCTGFTKNPRYKAFQADELDT